jgi:hypothetical protein
MKLWGILRKDSRKIKDVVVDCQYANRGEVEAWDPLIGSVCQALDLSRPVILQKHVGDIARFSRAVFTQDDFIEAIDFDKFELAVFSETKK